MLSLPDDWEFSIRGLTSIFKNDGRDAVQVSLKRIEKAGYLSMEQIREKGRLGKVIWTVSDIPTSPCTEIPYTEKPCTVNPPQNKYSRTEDRTNEETKVGRDKVLSAERREPSTSDSPISYPHVETMEPEKKITRKKCVELFGEKATDDAKRLVDDYIDVCYPKYRCKEHPNVTHAARYAYVCRVLRCAMELYLPELEFAREALLYALKNEKRYDPTIFLVTRPQVLGMWILESNSVDPSIANDPYYGQNPTWIKPLPEIDAIPERDFEYFRENYQPW